jgi:hypothetical protein
MPSGTGTVLVPSPMPVDLPRPTPPDATGRKRVYVNPPVIHIGSAPAQLPALRFTNNTGGTVRIWLLEAASLFAAPPKGSPNFDNPFVVGAGATLDLELKPNLGYGDYPYHVFCDAIDHEADGNSPPRLSCP